MRQSPLPASASDRSVMHDWQGCPCWHPLPIEPLFPPPQPLRHPILNPQHPLRGVQQEHRKQRPQHHPRQQLRHLRAPEAPDQTPDPFHTAHAAARHRAEAAAQVSFIEATF